MRESVRDSVRESVRDSVRESVRDSVRESVRDSARLAHTIACSEYEKPTITAATMKRI